MKVEELMVGNRVLFCGVEDIIWRVEDNNYVTDNYGHGAYNADLEPIPLTEEWLMKLGFTNASTTSEWGGFLSPEFGNKNTSIRLERGRGGYIYDGDFANVKLKYVHQVQNLLFALTGKELTIDE